MASKPYTELLLERDDFTCFICGEKFESDYENINVSLKIMRVNGGLETMDNQAPCHLECLRNRNDQYNKYGSLNGVKIIEDTTEYNTRKPIKHVTEYEKKMCIGKNAWATLSSVQYALSQKRRSDLHYYKCKFCKKYHLGH